MARPTYRAQFTKIENAYIGHTFDPWSASHGFWGTIFNHDERWAQVYCMQFEGDLKQAIREDLVSYYSGSEANEALCHIAIVAIIKHSGGLYTAADIIRIEKNFMHIYVSGDETEDALYQALVSSLAMLREPHIRRNNGKVPEMSLNMRVGPSFDHEINKLLGEAGIDPLSSDTPPKDDLDNAG